MTCAVLAELDISRTEMRKMMNKKEKKWMKAAGIRAVKTMAQTAAATIGTTVLLSEVDWRMVISTSVLSGILSLLTSVAGLPEVGKE